MGIRAQSQKRTFRTGFTLIELLVVIMIIAILAAILFPVFLRAKAAARGRTCASNLGQMGKAFNMYMDDWSAPVPPGILGYVTWKQEDSPPGWCEKLFPYHKKIGLYKCPGRKVNYAYAENCRLGDPSAACPARPSKLIAIFEAPGTGWGPIDPQGNNEWITGDADITNESQTEGYCYGRDPLTGVAYVKLNPEDKIENHQWLYPSEADYGTHPAFNWLFFPGPHNGRSNILFFDGHVSSFSDWAKRRMTFDPARK